MNYITVEVAPAGDVARLVVGGDLPSLRKAGGLDILTHNGALVQLQQGHVVSVTNTHSLIRHSLW